MVRINRLKTELYGLVGFRQPTQSGYNIVNTENQDSRSGLYFQDACPLITVQNIKDNHPNRNISDSQFNTYLKQLIETCILEVYNDVTAGKTSHLQSTNLYPYEKTFDKLLPVNVPYKFVCFEVFNDHKLDKVTTISSIELSFNEAISLDVHWFNSNLPNPVKTVSVTTIVGQPVQFPLKWILGDYEEHKGGRNYIGYFEDDLGTAQPYERKFENASLQRYSDCYYIRPTKVGHTAKVLDLRDKVNQPDTGGLGMVLDVYGDFAELLIRNQLQLANAIQLKMGIKILEMLISSTRANRTERLLKDQWETALVELNGYEDKTMKKVGVLNKYYQQVYDLKKQFFYTPIISRATLH